MHNEKEIREKIKMLRQFYTNLMIYAAIGLLCLCVWITTGGTFWPLWVILGFVISAFLQGIKLGMFPIVEDIFPFLKPEWEEEKLRDHLETNTSSFFSSPEKEKSKSEKSSNRVSKPKQD